MISLWKLVGQGNDPLVLPDMSSLDSITRQLPGGFYTTFRTYHTRTHVLGLKAHLDRLYGPVAKLPILPTIDRLELRRRLASMLAAFPATEVRLRLTLALVDGSGAVFAAFEPFQPLADAIYIDGVSVISTTAHRDHPALKSTTFIGQSQRVRSQLIKQSIFEGLIVQNGRILEGLTSNFFYLTGGNLGTAARGVLNGVTRRQVLRIARETGMDVIYRALALVGIDAIDEAFLTSSSRGIVPIVTIDTARIGSGGVGQGTRRLMSLYDTDVEKRLEKIYGGT